jgi:hypothetical protein
MTDKEISDKLAKIGYTTLWLNYGVLTIDNLIEQEQIFDNSNDHNTEHYRSQTFLHYLNSKNKLSEIEFDNYLRLTCEDNDQLMAGSAAVALFSKTDLTQQQFEKLCKSLQHFGKWTEKVVTRQTLLRKLRTSKLTSDLFKECIAIGDTIIHEYILDIADLNQLHELVTNGKTKKIRNVAKEKLNKLIRQQNSR